MGVRLSSLPGVYSLSTGQQIAKPVIHGLYGNRLGLITNGIRLPASAGATTMARPLIPLASSQIRVIKGAGALAYAGGNIGGKILVDPEVIPWEKGLHGNAIFFGESNGKLTGMHAGLFKRTKTFAWRIENTLKRSGDRKAPDYFLRNTGTRKHTNVMEKSWSAQSASSLWLSSYNAKLGILRGSHIGNTNDLEEAIGREIPFFTEDQFRSDIEAPFQQVHHHTLKVQHTIQSSPYTQVSGSLGLQLNRRREYDLRRSGRSDIPALSLNQFSSFVELSWERRFIQTKTKLKSGLQYQLVNNSNLPETGILPLIPDYLSQQGSLYSVVSGGKMDV
ncbi:MAG: TonB-dependent receptor plug domain-containing protein [Bacteroidia bacterium]